MEATIPETDLQPNNKQTKKFDGSNLDASAVSLRGVFLLRSRGPNRICRAELYNCLCPQRCVVLVASVGL